MIAQYTILNCFVTVNKEMIGSFPTLEKFCVPVSLKKHELLLNIEIVRKVHMCYGIEYLDTTDWGEVEHIFWSCRNKSFFIYTITNDYSKSFFCTSKQCPEDSFLELFLVVFYSYMSIHKTLLMHASAIEYQGKSVVFTAPSGIGKTTQAELWQKYRDATILNGDKVFLKQESDAIHAWGSPWKGSSPYAVNKSAPLAAIVVLQQDSKNSIRKLDIMEAMELFVPHVFFPRWDEKCESAVLEFLDKVMRKTDIYLLKCRPDKEAVDITAEAVFGEPGMIGE